VVVEALVYGRHHHLGVGVVLGDALQALGGGEDGHELDPGGPPFLEEGEGEACASSRGQHGVQEEGPALGDVRGELDVVLHGV